MPGRLAIDFGTSNTVVAVWNEQKQAGIPLYIPDFTHIIRQGDEEIPVIPSLIHYTTDRRQWIGNQVLQQNLYHSERTFRWMKRYIGHRSQIRLKMDGREISQAEAGRDFLSSILLVAAQEAGVQEEEIALTVPIEAYEHYEEWISEVAEASGLARIRLIDEASAAALGYGAHIQPGNVYLIFDFGGGTLHASVVLIESEELAAAGKRCRVLGKSGIDIGGASIDQWLFEEVLRLNRLNDIDEEVRRVSNAILVECERVKETLSFRDQADLSVINPYNGALIGAEFSRTQFEEILDQHDLFSEINRTIRAALNASRERGYCEEDIRAVLMVGGSSQIPSVQRAVRQLFDRERVYHEHALDAVARGGAAFVAGVDFFDHVQHDYAIRYRNPQTGEYDYRIVVPRGTAYPTDKPVARLSVKATYEGQAQLGIAIFEVGSRRAQHNGQSFELIFDPSGAARVMQVTPDEEERRTYFWMNEQNPTFLKADPPGRSGEARFEIEFNIDDNKRLLVTARDLVTHQLTHRNYPVVKLT